MRAVGWASLLSVLAACGQPPPMQAEPSFIALTSDFRGFSAWPNIALGYHEGDALHLPGTRSLYLNRRPASGSRQFPTGTVLVKVVDSPLGLQVFAMAKRGGEYNSGGAVGWEWFELSQVDEPVSINWRGTQAPASSAYGGDSATCNSCHQAAVDNDWVMTPELSLERF
jgi:hypothetical protein